MLFPRACPLLALFAIAAFAQTPPSPSMPGPSPARQQAAEPPLSCGLCAAPTEPGALDGTNQKAIDKAIRSLGFKLLPGVASAQTPPSGKPVPNSKPVPQLSGKVNARIVTRNSPCSVPLVRVPIDPNVDPQMVLRLPAPTAPMPQIQVPAPPCDEPTALDQRVARRDRR